MNKKREQHDRDTHTPLSDAEKKEMKAAFAAFLDMHPVREPARGPLARFVMMHRLAGTYAVVGLSVACMFTAGLSEFSLPDDSLYAVKTGINERIMLASTYVSPALHARAEHAVLTRRLAEAEQLMLLDRFKSETADEMQHTIDEHASALDESIARAAAAGESEEAMEVKAERDATLAKYDPLLDIIELRQSVEDPSVIDTLIEEAVKEHGDTLVGGSAAEIVEIEEEIMHGYADAMLTELVALHEDIADLLDEEDGHATGTVAELLGESNELRENAETELDANDAEGALTYLNEAVEHAEAALEEVAEGIEAE